MAKVEHIRRVEVYADNPILQEGKYKRGIPQELQNVDARFGAASDGGSVDNPY